MRQMAEPRKGDFEEKHPQYIFGGRNTILAYLGNTKVKPRSIFGYTLAYDIAKGKVYKKKVVVGTKEKKIYLRKTKANPLGNHSIPMVIPEYTHVYTGRTKAFYDDPQWRAKADEIKAAEKKVVANFGKVA